MPKTTKTRPGKGVPRRSANKARQAKYGDYRARSTCWCGSVFRSPSKKAAHEATHSTQLK